MSIPTYINALPGLQTLQAETDDKKRDAEFKEKVTQSEDAIILDCFATWCGPCKAIAPKVAEFSNAYPQAKFYQIDIDQLASTAAELGVRAMPTFMLFKGGQKVSEVVGADSNKLKAGIESLVA